MPEKTLIVLNPHAGGGRAGKLWSRIEPLLWDALGELLIAVTDRPSEVALHLDKARRAGLTRVITIGGDGTNHALVNALMRLNQLYPNSAPMTFGCLPIGTGHDWARTLGIPNTPAAAVRWIAAAHAAPLDVGQISFVPPDLTATDQQQTTRYFLNIASGGIGGQIDRHVNALPRRYPWTFLNATIQAIRHYVPQTMTVKLDGQPWYTGRAWVVAVANGKSFGHGMRIAPEARYDDSLFDVVLIEGMSRRQAIAALYTVYLGTHVKRADVHVARARQVELDLSPNESIGLDLDGEPATGRTIRFDVLPAALHTLVAQPI